MSKISSFKVIDFEKIAKSMISATAPSPAEAKMRFEHCKRVAKICQRLAGDMTCVDKDKLYICGIIHDMYKFLDNHSHDYMAGMWLENLVMMYDSDILSEWEDYIAAVKHHSQLPTNKSKFPSMILYEADKLDKIDQKYIRDSVKISHKYETESAAMSKAIEKINKIKYQTSPWYKSIRDEYLNKCLSRLDKMK